MTNNNNISPSKSTPVQSPATSPRLRSPRGSHPRQTTQALLGLLRHTKSLLVCLVLAAIVLTRPSSLDLGPSFTIGTVFGDAQNLDSPDWTTSNSQTSEDDDDNTADSSPQTIEQDIDRRVFDIPNIITSKESEDEVSIHTETETVPVQSGDLSSYDLLRQPIIVLPEGKHTKVEADVHLIIDVAKTDRVGTEAKVLLDGLERSPLINVVGITFLNPDVHQVSMGKRTMHPMVWMVDWGSMERDCHRLRRVLETLERKPEEDVVLVDLNASTRQSKCEHMFPDDPKFRLVKRSVVEGRHYDITTKQVHEGYISPNTGGDDGGVGKASLVVREGFIEAMAAVRNDKSVLKSKRNINVCFFWKPGDNSHYGFWRRDVSHFLQKHGKRRKYSTLVNVAANDVEGMLSGHIQLKYVDALLRCQIVVVAQRDEWADHYRLYESLASGAMVLMDQMLAPPAGLKNKTNVVVYDSLESLGELIDYYVKHVHKRKSIARRGMELVRGRHRSWHLVEAILFGSPMTHVGDADIPAPPKNPRPELSLVDGDIVVST